MSRFDYDLAGIGGGAGGPTSVGVGASFGMKVVLIEAKKLGGDCTWHNCVPSKTLTRAAPLRWSRCRSLSSESSQWFKSVSFIIL